MLGQGFSLGSHQAPPVLHCSFSQAAVILLHRETVSCLVGRSDEALPRYDADPSSIIVPWLVFGPRIRSALIYIPGMILCVRVPRSDWAQAVLFPSFNTRTWWNNTHWTSRTSIIMKGLFPRGSFTIATRSVESSFVDVTSIGRGLSKVVWGPNTASGEDDS